MGKGFQGMGTELRAWRMDFCAHLPAGDQDLEVTCLPPDQMFLVASSLQEEGFCGTMRPHPNSRVAWGLVAWR